MIYAIVILAIIIFISKIFFWLYTFQLKEYRFDRFREYALTRQWKKAFLNLFIILEAPFFLISFIWIYNKIIWKNLIKTVSEQLYIPILWILVIEFLFLLLKIKRKTLLKPTFTFRAILLFIISIFLFIFLWIFIYLKYNFLFSFYLLFSLLFPYLYIFISNIFILPIINYSKNKVLKNAEEISKKYNKPKKVAITGSYWKSTVKEFLSQILASKYEVLKTPKNVNTEMWVSEVIINRLNNNYDFFIAEMWAYRIWEIKTLWQIVNHKDAFLTAIWNQHLWLFWSKENIQKAKFEIALKVKENNWTLYLNIDSLDIVDYLKKNNLWDINIVLYWVENPAMAHSEIIKADVNSTIFKFTYKDISETFETNIIWKHNVVNLTWVIAFCLNNWMTTKEIKKAILEISLPQDSYLVKDLKVVNNFWEYNVKVIASTRNLSVASLETWIEILCHVKNYKRRILVIEDILELWKDARKIHKSLWKKIWKRDIDHIFFVWANYVNSFLEWLYEADFEWNFSDSWFDKEEIKDDSVIMFLWKRTQKSLEYFLNHAWIETKIQEIIK